MAPVPTFYRVVPTPDQSGSVGTRDVELLPRMRYRRACGPLVAEAKHGVRFWGRFSVS
jgi:hypothetical protein